MAVGGRRMSGKLIFSTKRGSRVSYVGLVFVSTGCWREQ